MNRHVDIDGWADAVVGKNDQSLATTRKVKRQTEGWPDSCCTGSTKLSYGLPRLPSVVARDKDQDARAQRQCYRGYFGCLQLPLRIANWLRFGPGRQRPGEPGWTESRELLGQDGGPVRFTLDLGRSQQLETHQQQEQLDAPREEEESDDN